jgi:hypothetical protein
MPYPEPGESKKDYISRCIPYVIKEKGIEQDQAVAICYGLWKEHGPKNESIEDKILSFLDEESIINTYKGGSWVRNLKVVKMEKGSKEYKFTIKLLSGTWPSDVETIMWCGLQEKSLHWDVSTPSDMRVGARGSVKTTKDPDTRLVVLKVPPIPSKEFGKPKYTGD